MQLANENVKMLANPPIPTTEQVMEELNHATNLVLQSEARGELHEVGAGIIATAVVNYENNCLAVEKATKTPSPVPLLLMSPEEAIDENHPIA
ncbi:hypothetical protein YC2023_011594 [Brassica napus]